MTIDLDHANRLAGLALTLLLIMGALLGAARWFIRTELAPIRQQTGDVHAQVVNSHATNLRDDIDDLRVAVHEVERRTSRRLDRIDDAQQTTAEALSEHVEQSKALMAKGAESEQDIRHSLADVAAAVKNLTEGG